MDPCPICLSAVAESDVVMPCCRKRFHERCIAESSKHKQLCPTCRAPLPERFGFRVVLSESAEDWAVLSDEGVFYTRGGRMRCRRLPDGAEKTYPRPIAGKLERLTVVGNVIVGLDSEYIWAVSSEQVHDMWILPRTEARWFPMAVGIFSLSNAGRLLKHCPGLCHVQPIGKFPDARRVVSASALLAILELEDGSFLQVDYRGGVAPTNMRFVNSRIAYDGHSVSFPDGESKPASPATRARLDAIVAGEKSGMVTMSWEGETVVSAAPAHGCLTAEYQAGVEGGKLVLRPAVVVMD